MVKGEHLKSFTYLNMGTEESLNSDIWNLYKEVLDTKLGATESKHYTEHTPLKEKFREAAKRVDYDWALFGSHRNGDLDEERNIIMKMKESDFNRPIRFVIDQDGIIWTDNTHTAMAYILRYGKNTTIKDIPFYIIDSRNEVPIIIDYNHAVLPNLDDIKSAIASALRINERKQNGWREDAEMRYSISDLIEGTDLSKDMKTEVIK